MRDFQLFRVRQVALLLALLALLAAGCAPPAGETAVLPATSAALPPPTLIGQSALATVTQTAPTPTLPPPATATTTAVLEPTARLQPTSQPPPAATTRGAPGGAYEVAFVASNDILNVRSGPGADNPSVAALDPRAGGIAITGDGVTVAGSLWVPVSDGQVSGWVNSRFLTADLAGEAFCADPEARAVVQALQTAVGNEDGRALAALVHPQRGLRLRLSWWNPEILVSQDQVANLFASQTVYDWGIADGSGLPISGTFAEVLYPLLERDLLQAGTATCNTIEAGPTAGLVQLPDAYANVNHFSTFRQGEVEGGFDWGSWAIGIERWQGRYYLSYLVHYGYEI